MSLAVTSPFVGAPSRPLVGESPLLRKENSPPAENDGVSLIDLLLRRQQETPVETFSRLHDDAVEPLQARYYRDLIPALRPGEGQQYAFEVDLDSCTGCKACVAACHNLNGLEEDET